MRSRVRASRPSTAARHGRLHDVLDGLVDARARRPCASPARSRRGGGAGRAGRPARRAARSARWRRPRRRPGGWPPRDPARPASESSPRRGRRALRLSSTRCTCGGRCRNAQRRRLDVAVHEPPQVADADPLRRRDRDHRHAEPVLQRLLVDARCPPPGPRRSCSARAPPAGPPRSAAARGRGGGRAASRRPRTRSGRATACPRCRPNSTSRTIISSGEPGCRLYVPGRSRTSTRRPRAARSWPTFFSTVTPG